MHRSTRLESRLWHHQLKAVTLIDDYLRQTSHDGRSALVTMPTGTGKSAVIARAIEQVSSREGQRSQRDHILVVTPWSGLVAQLSRDLRSRVWERLGASRPDEFPQVRALPPTDNIEKLKGAPRPCVFVATTAKVLKIFDSTGDSVEAMQNLFRDFAAVFVDECHYEPAPQWSQAIRAIGRPTILLTATPYRNDHKFFLVDNAQQYRYLHSQAVSDGFLRTPEFRTLASGGIDGFVEELVRIVEDVRRTHPDTRTIIRCSTASQIKDIVKVLHGPAYGQAAIGIHDTLDTDAEAGHYHYTPNPDFNQDRFWVHQFKLVEGLDDARFRVLAFYDGLGNDRGTVQQLGRVLRNPTRDTRDSTAWVASRPAFDVEAIWCNYQYFDAHAGEGVATSRTVVDELVDAAPTSVYYDGRFRVPLRLAVDDSWRHYKFPLAARIFRPGPDLDLAALADDVAEEWREEDREVFTLQWPDSRTVVAPFVVVANSPFLRTAAFIEASFGFTVLRHSGQHLFVFDTDGRTPQCLRNQIGLETPGRLSRLLAGDSRLTKVSLDNTDIGPRAIRARTLRAASIEETSPELTDYAYVCSVAEGYPPVESDDDRFRRYVGISRSRVRDTRRCPNTFAEFAAWTDEISSKMDVHGDPTVTLRRYADTSDVPDDRNPLHILLDLHADDFARVGDDGKERPLVVEDAASPLLNGHGQLRVDGHDLAVTVSWTEARGKYEFVCSELAKLNYRERLAPRRELVSVINAEQRMRIVPATDGFLYANGHFARPIRPDQARDRFWLLDILTPVDALASTKSEKGTPRSDNKWAPDTVFGLIDGMAPPRTSKAGATMSALFPSLDMLFCADLNKEIADFIAVQPDRIALIHAKAGDGSQLAPSALHEVVSQATKNLLWLQPLNGDIPYDATHQWSKRWRVTQRETKRVHVVDRQRHGTFADGTELWTHARSVITDPAADREVWLVLGAALSKSALERGVDDRTPEMIQMYALLQSCWSAVNQVGARLRVFCSP